MRGLGRRDYARDVLFFLGGFLASVIIREISPLEHINPDDVMTSHTFEKENSSESTHAEYDFMGGGSIHELTFPVDIEHPVWENSSDQADAIYKLASGTWLSGSHHLERAYDNYSDRGPKFLNDEELTFLKWSEHITNEMTVKNASTRVAFKLWGQSISSLYNTSKRIPSPNSNYFCRMSWGYHWCDPVRHGYEFVSFY